MVLWHSSVALHSAGVESNFVAYQVEGGLASAGQVGMHGVTMDLIYVDWELDVLGL